MTLWRTIPTALDTPIRAAVGSEYLIMTACEGTR